MGLQGLVWITGGRIIATRRAVPQCRGPGFRTNLYCSGTFAAIYVLSSALRLLTCLIHSYRDRQSLPTAAKPGTTHRSGPKIVQADRHPDMRLGGANAIRRVEADPSQALYIGFSPGMPRLLGCDAVGAVKVAPDVARRYTERARCCDKDMGDVLTDSASKRESLRGSRCGVCWIGVEGNFTI